MQLLPRNSNRLTPLRQAASITCVSILRFSSRKFAGRLRLASMPPTVAAASTTTSGFCSCIQFRTAPSSSRFSSFLFGVRISPPWSLSPYPLRLECPNDGTTGHSSGTGYKHTIAWLDQAHCQYSLLPWSYYLEAFLFQIGLFFRAPLGRVRSSLSPYLPGSY